MKTLKQLHDIHDMHPPPQEENMRRPIYLGAVVPDGFVLLLTILLAAGET